MSYYIKIRKNISLTDYFLQQIFLHCYVQVTGLGTKGILDITQEKHTLPTREILCSQIEMYLF